MPDINYVNPQINNISKQKISIQVSLNGFSFLIKSAENNTCLLIRSYKFQNLRLIDELIRKTEEVIAKDQYLNSNFVQTEVTYVSQKTTLVPKEFFRTEHLKKYFEFNHTLNELDEIHYTEIPAISSYNVFSLPSYLTNTFYSVFPNVVFNHQGSYLINYGYRIASEENTILVSINSGFFDIAIFEENKLLLFNSFQYTNALDFIYFFLYPLSQLKIEATNQNIQLLGQVNNHNDIIKELKSCVKSITYPDIDNNSTCKYISNNQKLAFYNLFQ